MKYAKLFIVLILVFLVQLSVVPNLAIKTAYPNLMFIALIILILNFRFSEALVWAIFSGILFDIYSPMHFGIFTLSFVLLAIIIELVVKKFISSPMLLIVIGLFFVAGLLLDLPILLMSGKNITLYLYVNLYNTTIGVIVYYLLGDSLKPKESIYKLQ